MLRAQAPAPEADKRFVLMAAEETLLQTDLSKVALSNAYSPTVKSFAQRLINDHALLDSTLKALAAAKSISLPGLSEKQQKLYAGLAQKQGKEFDKAYAKMMLKGYKTEAEAFKKEATKGKDSEISSWAAGYLPLMLQHRDMAEYVDRVVKN